MISTFKDENEINTKHAACLNGGKEPVSWIDEKTSLNCRNIFHCFICKHFRTHPEKEDIHKLMSFLYILTFYLTGRANHEPEFMEGQFKPTEKIIKSILNHMAEKYGVEALIDKMHEQVFTHGKLSLGWARWFMLIRQAGGY